MSRMARDSSEGILPADVLEYVFCELREDDLEYWDDNRYFPYDPRALSACALVSRSWRALALRHLFRDLVFTHGRVVDQDCVDAKHPPWGCRFCNCSCHWEEGERDRRTVPDLLEFLERSPHVRQAVRTLRLRTPPFFKGLRIHISHDPFDLTSLLSMLACLPRLASIHLEDVLLSRELGPKQSLRLSVEELTVGTCLAGDLDDTVQRIVQHFRCIGCLRFPSSLNGMPLNFQTRVGSVGFCEDSYSDGDTVFDLISKAESGPRSLDVTGLPAEDDVRLQALINAVGDRLHHFCYVHRAPLLMGVLRTPPPSRPRIAAMDLSRCTSLRTFYTSINFYKLEEDLHAAICPTLRSLQAGAPGALAQIVITAWVRLNLATLCNDNAGRRSFSELESAALALRDGRGLSELVFRLLYKRRCVGSESLLSECTSALHDALPRLARAGILRVVSKDVGSLERESIYGSAKRRTQIADMVMSLVSEQVPPHLPPADAQSRYDQNRGS